MPEPSIIERMARAMCRDQYSEGEDDWLETARCRRWELFVSQSRAALAAIRKPTEAMLVGAGAMWGFMDGYQPVGMTPDQCHVEWWQSMIDAADDAPPSTSPLAQEGGDG